MLSRAGSVLWDIQTTKYIALERGYSQKAMAARSNPEITQTNGSMVFPGIQHGIGGTTHSPSEVILEHITNTTKNSIKLFMYSSAVTPPVNMVKNLVVTERIYSSHDSFSRTKASTGVGLLRNRPMYGRHLPPKKRMELHEIN